ncbi:MAG: hypothetical protein ACI4NE_04385 [Succinivibrio sp.]
MKLHNIILSIIAVALFVIIFLLYNIIRSDKTTDAEVSTQQTDSKTNVCLAFNTGAIENCQKGSQLLFLPQTWGNDQLPILVAGYNCDFNHPVVYNNGGVTCIKATEGVNKEPEKEDEKQ